MSSLVGAQLGMAAILGIGSLLFGNLPVLLIRYLNKNRGGSVANVFHNKSGFGSKVLSFLMCFGGGVLFATCFVHLIPEVQEHFEAQDEHQNETGDEGEEEEHHDEVPVGFLVISAGFFLVFAIEEILHVFLATHHHHGGGFDESNPPKPRRRTVSCISDEIRASGEQFVERYSKRTTSLSPVKEDGQEIVSNEIPNLPTGIAEKAAENKRANDNLESSAPSGNYQRQIDIDESAAYSMGSAEPTDVVNMVRGLMIVVALSFHSIFEGLAVGVQPTAGAIWTTGMAIAVHKYVIAFVVGLEVYSQTLRPKIVFIYLTAFSLMSPMGIIIATIAGTAMHGTTENVLNVLATGTIIYVVFFEILQKERHVSLSGILQLLAVVLGYGLMVGIQLGTLKYHVD